MKLYLISALILITRLSEASTFVGNGGSPGDVELLVAKKQITETLEIIGAKDFSQGSLCQCVADFQNDSLCEPLRSLNPEQRKYCVEVTSEKAKTLSTLISTEGKVSFLWTHDRIEVVEGKNRRAVDAASNREKMEITVNQNRFLDMSASERIFLLTHELLHLTEINGKPLTDEGPLGPFTGNDGSRNLINAVSAGTAMQAIDRRLIRKYRGHLRRPQGWKENWLEISGGSTRTSAVGSDVYATG